MANNWWEIGLTKSNKKLLLDVSDNALINNSLLNYVSNLPDFTDEITENLNSLISAFNAPSALSFLDPNYSSDALARTGLGLIGSDSSAARNKGYEMLLKGVDEQVSNSPFTSYTSSENNLSGSDINKKVPLTREQKLAKAKNAMGYVGAAADIIGGFLPERPEFSGTKGDLALSLNSAYDAASNMAMSINPIVGGAMKGLGVLNKGMALVGAGTDGMTTTDAIMSNPLMGPLGGWINGWFGKRANTISKNDLAFELVGSSYGGVLNNVDDALTKSGKKYGAFSGKARRNANRFIDTAKYQQELMADIADDALDRFNLSHSMAAINGNRRAYELLGGYDLSSVRVGKQGLKITPILARSIIASTKVITETPKEPELKITESVIELLSPESFMEEFKDGGSLNKVTTIDLVTPESIIDEVLEFKEGGEINIIPEGALHARKHHMEDDKNITKKGIPVVSEGEGGELELQAEIEREEIIFRLEVTKKLEELEEKYYNENTSNKEKEELALEAGLLLVLEIIYNTLDNTKNLL